MATILTNLVNDLHATVPMPYFIGVACYAVGIPLLQQILGKNYKTTSKLFKPTMFIYNILLAGFSWWCFTHSYEIWNRLPMYENNCTRWFTNEPNFTNAVYLFALSKYAEFLDTIFLVLNGKNWRGLHYFHHIGAPINMALLYYGQCECTILFILLNSFIHTVMYIYYGLMVYKHPLTPVLSLLKPLVTGAQICQFLVGLRALNFYMDVSCFKSTSVLVSTYWFTWIYVGIVLLLFTQFFVTEYVFASKKSSKKAE